MSKNWVRLLCLLTALPLVWWMMGTGRAAPGEARAVLVAVVDDQLLGERYTQFQAERQALEKEAKEKHSELNARTFLKDDELKEVSTLASKAKPSADEQKRINALLSEGQKRYEEWKSLSGLSSPTEAQGTRLRDLNRQMTRNKPVVDELREEYAGELQKKQQEVLERLQNVAREAMAQVAGQRGIVAILPKQGTLWSSPTIDVTEDVLKKLNGK